MLFSRAKIQFRRDKQMKPDAKVSGFHCLCMYHMNMRSNDIIGQLCRSDSAAEFKLRLSVLAPNDDLKFTSENFCTLFEQCRHKQYLIDVVEDIVKTTSLFDDAMTHETFYEDWMMACSTKSNPDKKKYVKFTVLEQYKCYNLSRPYDGCTLDETELKLNRLMLSIVEKIKHLKGSGYATLDSFIKFFTLRPGTTR